MVLRGACYSGKRSQSETLGFVLVFSLLIIGALVVVGLGATAISETETQLGEDRAEKTLTQFDSKAGLVALEEADSQRVSLPVEDEGQFFVNEDDGWMAVTIENVSFDTTNEVMNVSLGTVTYENRETTFAYQGGGVWRKTENGGQMLSPPEFHYRNGTLTLPAINVTGDSALSSSAVITQNGTTKKFPQPSIGSEWINPLENHQVNVTVQSDYYVGWGRYFEERTDGEAVYDHQNNTVTLELVIEAEYPPVEGGLMTGTSETLILKNNAEVDSYNSTDGEYAPSGGGYPYETDSKIIAASSVSVENNAILHGDLESGGDVYVDNNGEIRYGNVSHTDGFVNDGTWETEPKHWSNDNASVRGPDTVDRLIDDLIRVFSDTNDNNVASNISGQTLQNCSSSCTLHNGSYYLDQINLGNGENLQLNTTEGRVEIVVDGDITLDNDQEIEVVGDGRANIYVDGDTTLRNGAKVTVPKDNATQFWMYMRPNTTTEFRENVVYKGVVFGPGNFRPGTHITLDQNSEVYGGLLGDVDFQANNVWIHFDESLGKVKPVEYESTAVKITFLHVTINQIVVQNG